MTRTERRYYLLAGLYSLWAWFVAPFYPLFLASRGLDLFEVNAVLAIYLITIFVFEVPTGAIADVFGRRVSFLASCTLRCAGFGLYAFADGFVACAVAEVVDGIGTTLASGALEAWAVDGMRREGNARAGERFFARAQMIARGAMIAGGIVCGAIIAHSFAVPWLVGSAGFALTGLLAYVIMHEDTPPGASETTERVSILRAMREGWAIVREAPQLLVVFAISAAIWFAVAPVHMFWPPRVAEVSGEGFWLLGWVWAATNLVSVAGSALLPRLVPRFPRHRVLFAAYAWRGLTLGVAAWATGLPLLLAGWLLQEIGLSLSEPLLQSWTNDQVGPARRATVLSLRSMATTIGGGIGLLLIGLVARAAGIQIAWGISAAICVVVGVAVLLAGRFAESKSAEPPPTIAEIPPLKS